MLSRYNKKSCSAGIKQIIKYEKDCLADLKKTLHGEKGINTIKVCTSEALLWIKIHQE